MDLYRSYWWADNVSAAGTVLGQTALFAVATDAYGAALGVPAVFAARAVPYLLARPAAVALAGRLPPVLLSVATDSVRAVLTVVTGSLALAVAPLALLLAFVVLAGSADLLHATCRPAVLRSTAGGRSLTRAGAGLFLGETLAAVTVQLALVWLVPTPLVVLAFLLDAVSFSVGALLLARLHRRVTATAPGVPRPPERRPVEVRLRGLRTRWRPQARIGDRRDRPVLANALLWAGLHTAGTVVLVPLVTTGAELGGRGVALLFAAQSAGAAVAAALAFRRAVGARSFRWNNVLAAASLAFVAACALLGLPLLAVGVLAAVVMNVAGMRQAVVQRATVATAAHPAALAAAVAQRGWAVRLTLAVGAVLVSTQDRQVLVLLVAAGAALLQRPPPVAEPERLTRVG